MSAMCLMIVQQNKNKKLVEWSKSIKSIILITLLDWVASNHVLIYYFHKPIAIQVINQGKELRCYKTMHLGVTKI